jgi:hypothetical protein
MVLDYLVSINIRKNKGEDVKRRLIFLNFYLEKLKYNDSLIKLVNYNCFVFIIILFNW